MLTRMRSPVIRVFSIDARRDGERLHQEGLDQEGQAERDHHDDGQLPQEHPSVRPLRLVACGGHLPGGGTVVGDVRGGVPLGCVGGSARYGALAGFVSHTSVKGKEPSRRSRSSCRARLCGPGATRLHRPAR